MIKSDDYWMGLAFFISVGSEQGCVIVGSQNNLLAHGCSSSPKNLPYPEYIRTADKSVIQDNRIDFSNSIIYLTYTPSIKSIVEIVSANIKKIIYFKTEELDKSIQTQVQISKFNGNLNWMRDHLVELKERGIFK